MSKESQIKIRLFSKPVPPSWLVRPTDLEAVAGSLVELPCSGMLVGLVELSTIVSSLIKVEICVILGLALITCNQFRIMTQPYEQINWFFSCPCQGGELGIFFSFRVFCLTSSARPLSNCTPLQIGWLKVNFIMLFN